jgi:hypothetical protein
MMRIQAYAETQKGRTFVALSLYEAVSEHCFNITSIAYTSIYYLLYI